MILVERKTNEHERTNSKNIWHGSSASVRRITVEQAWIWLRQFWRQPEDAEHRLVAIGH
jgi:hypothetical protein